MEKEVERLKEQVTDLQAQIVAMRYFVGVLVVSETARNPHIIGVLQNVAAGRAGEPVESDLHTLPPGLSAEQKAEIEDGLAKGRERIKAHTQEMAQTWLNSLAAIRGTRF